MNIKQAKIWRFFSSIKLAIWLLSLIACFSLLGTVIPQGKTSAEYIGRFGHSIYPILSSIGLTNIYSAGWFILLLVLLSLNLAACLLNRFSLKTNSLGVTIVHISILVILVGALVGMLRGEKGYIQVREGETINSFTPQKQTKEHKPGQCPLPTSLGFSLRLDDFIYEKYANTEEKLLIYSEKGEFISEIPLQLGKESKIAKTGYTIKALRYVPDFVMDTVTKEATSRSAEPKNPAVELEIKGKNSSRKFWVFAFADYPAQHRKTGEDFKVRYYRDKGRPKDFISRITIIQDGKEVLKTDIRVNSPLKFGGYTFFQSSYDEEFLDWSGLQVVRDPGVPIVYLGFILLIIGLCLRFYINPFIKRRQ